MMSDTMPDRTTGGTENGGRWSHVVRHYCPVPDLTEGVQVATDSRWICACQEEWRACGVPGSVATYWEATGLGIAAPREAPAPPPPPEPD